MLTDDQVRQASLAQRIRLVRHGRPRQVDDVQGHEAGLKVIRSIALVCLCTLDSLLVSCEPWTNNGNLAWTVEG
jgi:hypothetical protein